MAGDGLVTHRRANAGFWRPRRTTVHAPLPNAATGPVYSTRAPDRCTGRTTAVTPTRPTRLGCCNRPFWALLPFRRARRQPQRRFSCDITSGHAFAALCYVQPSQHSVLRPLGLTQLAHVCCAVQHVRAICPHADERFIMQAGVRRCRFCKYCVLAASITPTKSATSFSAPGEVQQVYVRCRSRLQSVRS